MEILMIMMDVHLLVLLKQDGHALEDHLQQLQLALKFVMTIFWLVQKNVQMMTFLMGTDAQVLVR